MNKMIRPSVDLENLKVIVENILAEAVQQGASEAEVDLGVNKGFSVNVRKGDVESIEYNQDKDIDITVYFGKKMGGATLSDFRPEAIHAAVSAACNIARFTDEDPYAGLADKSSLAFHYPKLELAYPWSMNVERAVELGKECEAQALSKDKRITNSDGVSVSTSEVWNVYGNTLGFIGDLAVTRHEISCMLIAAQNDQMQRDYSYTIASDPNLLDSIEQLASEAVQRTVCRLGARCLTTRQAPVIFVADQARSLLGHFVAAISGSNLYRKSSFLLDYIGKPVFSSHIKIDEHPHLPKALGSTPFDDDGVLTSANLFVLEGILQSYALGTYSARKLGLKTTGNSGGVHNLFINTGNKELSALLKTMGTGLLVTELMGQGVNLVTGDYSRGASGFWVERGEIQYPVEGITIAGNLRDMFLHLVEVGSDVDKRGNIQTGSILIENMMVAGE